MTSLSEKSINNSLTRANKKEIIDWGMPDYSSTLSGVGNNYTAPYDGIFLFSVSNNNSARNIGIVPNGSSQVVFYKIINSYGTTGGFPVILAKGDRIIIDSTSTSLSYSYFVPLKGI